MNKRALDRVLRAIAGGKISRAAAAAALEVGERHVNRLMAAAGVSRPRSQAHDRRLTAQMRREARERAARAVLGKVQTVEFAALTAGCSPRTVRRWMAKLSKKRTKTTKSAIKTTIKRTNAPKTSRKR